MGAIASQEKPSLHNTQDRLGLGSFSNYESLSEKTGQDQKMGVGRFPKYFQHVITIIYDYEW